MDGNASMMKNAHNAYRLMVLFLLSLPACSAPASSPSAPVSETAVAMAVATETQAPTATAVPEPSLTPTSAPLQLEVVEWSTHTDVPGYPIVEILLRNPNGFPVRVNNDDSTEASVMNLAGETLATTSDVNYWVWSDVDDFAGGFILPGETVPVTVTFYPTNEGEEIPDWESIRLDADPDEVVPVPFTRDVEVSLGEFRSTLEFDDGATLTLTNASGQPLRALLYRATARGQDGAFVGLAGGAIAIVAFRDDAGNPLPLEPGATIELIFLPNWNRDVPQSLAYEIEAIGLLADE